LFTVWDSLLQETELDASVHTDIAAALSRSVSRPLLEKTFHMKIQSRKVFTNRESFENLLAKTEDLLMKVRQFNLFVSIKLTSRNLLNPASK
jgi:hypothetical protein